MLYNMSIFKIFSLIFFSLSASSFVFMVSCLLKGVILLVDWEIFQIANMSLVYSLIFDWISASFLSVVFLISASVMFYSHEYMSHEKTKNAFAFIVFLFVLSMMFLIVSPNLVSVILGWDGLGLVSYLLVIYYQNFKSYAAGMITCLSNRIGDSALLIGMGWFLSLGTVDFIYYSLTIEKEVLVASIFIVLAAMTKSAQIPFSSWLPAAMAAPTPVSALVHSSTLVTAGVYLLVRFFPLFSFSGMKSFLFISGALTMTMSSLGALYEMDLKKIIALSTLSQLGLMMMALSMNLYLLAFFHLLTHALFKASLFLSAGSMIHLFSGSQDVRNLSMVTSYMPFTSSCLLICSLSLSGFPFLSAFYSKDKIIEEGFSMGLNSFCLFMLFISVMFTMIYSFRLVYFISKESYDMRYEMNEDSSMMSKSIGLLTLGGIMGGSSFSWLMFDAPYDNLWLSFKVLIIFLLFLGLVWGLILKFNQVTLLSFYLGNMWFLSALSAKFITFLGLSYGKSVSKYWDGGWNELIGPQGLKKELNFLSLASDKLSHMSFKLILFSSFLLMLLMCLL